VSETTPWIKASASGNTGECVELRRNGEAREVRDSKNPDGAVLGFTPAALQAWIEGAKHGEYDHLAD
jgi:hypothetical protein